jgi:hypothetical protein
MKEKDVIPTHQDLQPITLPEPQKDGGKTVLASLFNTEGTLLPGRGLSRVGSASTLNGLRLLFFHQGTGADGVGCPARSASGRRCRPRTLGCAAGRQGQGAESMGGSC